MKGYSVPDRGAYLERFHSLHKPPRAAVSLGGRIIQLQPLEETDIKLASPDTTSRGMLVLDILCRAVPARTHPVHLSNHVRVDPALKYRFHQSQMLQVVVCLKQCVTSEKLDQNAADTPDITGEGPAKPKYDLRRPVVACRNH
jgi:hypothetical protein